MVGNELPAVAVRPSILLSPKCLNDWPGKFLNDLLACSKWGVYILGANLVLDDKICFDKIITFLLI